jgi:hypothetical protein
MKPSSAKAKGRTFQQWVAKKILEYNPTLEKDDVVSTSMGAPGADVKLSPAARKLFPYQIECKSLAKIAVYNYYLQALTHGHHEPIVFIKQNGSRPLVIVDAEHLIKYLGETNGSKSTV